MEHGVPGEDEVVADLDIVSDKVVLLKLPALIAEFLPVPCYVGRDYVIPGVVNVIPRPQIS